jgi:ABC-type antimicrobial peptide transport system permease subunit
MIKNYFKTAWRNLQKNRLSSSINIAGLGLAVGCCLVAFVYLTWRMNSDDFQKNRDKIYVIERIESKDGAQQLWGNSPAPIGPMLKSDYQQIKNYARLNLMDANIKQGDNVFAESVSFVDNPFYDMFNFPVKWGNKQTFTDPDGIVLSEELSEKLFGKENPVGKSISANFNSIGNKLAENFIVKGVFEKRPVESSFYFSALIPFSKLAALGINTTSDWGQSVSTTFLETANKNAALPNLVKSKKYVDLYNSANKDTKITGYNFQPLKSMQFHSYKVNLSQFNSGNIIGDIMISAIALSILILVCFNYMNIAIASASNRLKEIGVRKVLGSSRKQIIFYFLIENFILCVIGAILGVLLAKFLFIPWFTQIANFNLSEILFSNTGIWIDLLALIFIIVIGSAAYPAFYISSLKPVSIVKGKMILGNKNRFRKSLLGFQFFLTFLGLSMTLAFVRENKIARSKPWGYVPENNVVLKLNGAANFDVFKTHLKNDHNIISVTGSVQPLGNWSKQMLIRTEGKEETILGLQALPGFASQLGIKITNGRDLSDKFLTDETASVIVNQVFLKMMHWATGIGKTIEYNNHNYIIVGETNDFHFENFRDNIKPLIIMGCKPEDVKFAYAKTGSNLFKNAHTTIAGIWKKTYPDLPFDYYYQDAVFDNYFNGFTQVTEVMSAASIIMIIVSITGIFGLALLILGKKMKDISIRKVLGAGISNISFQIIKEFLFAIGFAILIGVPISYMLTKSIFNQVTPESHVSFLPMIITFIGLIIMTLISVLWHLYKAFLSNPVKSLRTE